LRAASSAHRGHFRLISPTTLSKKYKLESLVLHDDIYRLPHFRYFQILSSSGADNSNRLLSEWRCGSGEPTYLQNTEHLLWVLRLRVLYEAGGYPPNVLQPTEAYCANPALVSPFHLQRRSTSAGVRDLYQRKVELWARNVRSNLTTSTVVVGFFYMPQSCDMGQTALLPLRRKAC
jgi:hypothetical protein